MGWGEMIAMALLAAAVAIIVWPREDVSSKPLVPEGTPLPPLMAEGWLNTERAPSRDKLAEQVVVVDCWATWCAPCRAAMPELARLYDQYEPMGVVFIGFTSESESERDAVKNFVESVGGFDWPVGYGAGPTLEMLGIRYLPTLIVFNDGRAVWSSNSTDELASVLDEQLAKSK